MFLYGGVIRQISSGSAAAAAAAAATATPASVSSNSAPKKRTRDGTAQGVDLKKARIPLTLEQAICSAPVEDIPLILGDRLAIEMTAITRLYDHCIALTDDRPLAPYSKEGLWEVQFGAPYDMTDNIQALIGIIKQYGCIPSEIPADRLSFINDGFLDVMEKIDEGNSELILSDMGLILLPPRLWECKNLRVLDLDDNALATLPDQISELCNLTDLSLSGNLLRTLPPLPALTALKLVENPLGSLPPALKNLDGLKILELENVGLSELPEWIGELSELEEWNLRDNTLMNLPQSFMSLNALKRLYIGGNRCLPRGALLGGVPEGCYVDGFEDLADDSGAAAAAPE